MTKKPRPPEKPNLDHIPQVRDPKKEPKPKVRPKETRTVDRDEIVALVKRLDINTPWDWLIFGDGSGSTFDRGAGWCAISVERKTMEERVWRGAMNFGTVNIAEIMAYMAPLTYIADQQLRKSNENVEHGLVQVVIVTDSQYVQRTGNGTCRASSNAGLWAVLNTLKRDGLIVRFIHQHRDREDLNRRCDVISKSSRKIIESAVSTLEQVVGAVE